MVDANIIDRVRRHRKPQRRIAPRNKEVSKRGQGGTSSIERVHTIQNAGLDVWCGMIVGFDHDDSYDLCGTARVLEDARVLHAMVGMLSAIPKTPLHARLAAEGRLDEDHEAEFGTNVIPASMSRDELRDGYVQLMQELYEPHAYFDRLDELFLQGNFRFSQTRAAYWRRHPWSWLRGNATQIARSRSSTGSSCMAFPRAAAANLSRRIARLLRSRRDPVVLFVYLLKCVIHYHLDTMVREMSTERRIVNTF